MSAAMAGRFMRKVVAAAVLAGALATSGGAPAVAAGPGVEPPNQDWSFEGIFGGFDRASAQRGLQVYKQVCAACHGMDHLAYRNIVALGYTPEQVAAFAAEFQIEDGPNDQGQMFMRPAIPADTFRSPFPNDAIARLANNGAMPVDLSMIIKARGGGADYVYAFLVGYNPPPEDVSLMPGMHWNEYYPGHQVAMPNMLFPGMVQFADGTEATPEQMAWDVTNFLAWANYPELETRKEMGIKVILFLIVFTGLMYAVKRKLWADVH